MFRNQNWTLRLYSARSTLWWDVTICIHCRYIYLLTYLLIYLLTYSMGQSSSWEANRFSASQEILLIFMEPKGSLPQSQVPATCPYPKNISPGPRLTLWLFRNTIRVLQWGVVSTSPNPQAGDHPLSAVRDCLFNIFAATLHIGGRSSMRNLRTCHALVKGTHLHMVSEMWC
jgi:hypothetical protein